MKVVCKNTEHPELTIKDLVNGDIFTCGTVNTHYMALSDSNADERYAAELETGYLTSFSYDAIVTKYVAEPLKVSRA